MLLRSVSGLIMLLSDLLVAVWAFLVGVAVLVVLFPLVLWFLLWELVRDIWRSWKPDFWR